MGNTREDRDIAGSRALIAGYYADPPNRLSFARELFNRTAQHYDPVNRLLSLGSGAWYRRTCLQRAGLRSGLQVVDIAIGTGLLAREALRITGDRRLVVGIDVSEAMLGIARDNLDVPLVQGAAEALPLGDDIADFVTMGYALRHVADLEAVFRESFRVLRPQGKVLLLEMSTPRRRLNRVLASMYIGSIVPLVSLLTRGDLRAWELMRYHWETIVKGVPPEAIMDAMRESGFRQVECRTELDLFRCYLGRKT
jgi:demethylmenaquinone methyltransferase/2-methoxy-6-polyprenyl-1,4-benzoquinol methylase